MKKEKRDYSLYHFGDMERMIYLSFPSEGITVAGYDPQCERLIIELAADDKIYEFRDVPERIWYEMRTVESVVRYIRSCIMGKYNAYLRKN